MGESDHKIVILGGYGKLGYAVADRLLEETAAHVALCGRDEGKARTAADALNAGHPGRRASFRVVDAADKQGMATAFKGADTVLVCITSGEHTEGIVQAVLSAGADGVDFRFPQGIVRELRELEDSIKARGKCFITQAGHFPGLASVLTRFAGLECFSLEEVVLATAISIPSTSSSGAAEEMVDIIRDFDGEIYANDRWIRAHPWQVRRIAFDHGFGVRMCLPAKLEEMRGLPEKFHLKKAGVYLAGVNRFVDGVVVPIIMTVKRIRTRKARRMLSRLLSWGIATFARPPFGAIVKVDAIGRREDGRTQKVGVSAFHEDSYHFAACAAVAGLLQYFDGTVAGGGLRFMGHEVDPFRFLNDMARMGVAVVRTTA